MRAACSRQRRGPSCGSCRIADRPPPQQPEARRRGGARRSRLAGGRGSPGAPWLLRSTLAAAGGHGAARRPAVGEQRPRRPPRVLTPRSPSAARPGARPAQSSSLGRRRSPGPDPGPGRRLLCSLPPPSVGTGPGSPGAGQLGTQGGLPGAGKEDKPRLGARGKGPAVWGAPTPAGAQRPLTRRLPRPRGCVSGSPAAAGRALPIRTANAEGGWASGAGRGGRERGPAGHLPVPARSTHRTRARGARSCLPAQQAARDARRLANPVPRAAPKPSVLALVSPCLSVPVSLLTPKDPLQFRSLLQATSFQNSSPSLLRKTEKESSG